MQLRHALFPDEDNIELARDMVARGLAGKAVPGGWPQHVWLAEDKAGAIGYVEVSIRAVAEGCWEDGPVPFIEGWYVTKDYRSTGVGRQLVQAVEAWAKAEGYEAIASNAEADNTGSIQAHLKLGFEDEGTTVNFRKELE